MKISLPIMLLCAAGLACALFATSAASQSGGTPAGATGGGTPMQQGESASIEEARAVLLDGLRAQARVGVARVLIDPANQSEVVPVAASVDVVFDGVALFSAHQLKIEPVGSAEPISWSLSGLTAASAQPTLSEVLPPRSYRFTVRPKAQKTWAQVKNEADIILSWELR